jgi:hypothetical protein
MPYLMDHSGLDWYEMALSAEPNLCSANVLVSKADLFKTRNVYVLMSHATQEITTQKPSLICRNF